MGYSPEVNHVKLLADDVNQTFFSLTGGATILGSSNLIILISFNICALVQLWGQRSKVFVKDCDERIELRKIKIKRLAQQMSKENKEEMLSQQNEMMDQLMDDGPDQADEMNGEPSDEMAMEDGQSKNPLVS